MIISSGDDWMVYLVSDYQTITDRLVVSDVASPDVLSGLRVTGDASQVLSISDMGRINNNINNSVVIIATSHLPVITLCRISPKT